MIRVQRQDFDIGAELADFRGRGAGVGAIASFIGLMRDFNAEDAVSEMTLEHYPGMTERALEGIVRDASSRWNVIDALVIHRYGTLRPGEQIVLVMIASAHRHDAFASCEFIMDYLKTKAPFWKKERVEHGERWVEARESDEAARERWA